MNLAGAIRSLRLATARIVRGQPRNRTAVALAAWQAAELLPRKAVRKTGGFRAAATGNARPATIARQCVAGGFTRGGLRSDRHGRVELVERGGARGQFGIRRAGCGWQGCRAPLQPFEQDSIGICRRAAILRAFTRLISCRSQPRPSKFRYFHARKYAAVAAASVKPSRAAVLAAACGMSPELQPCRFTRGNARSAGSCNRLRLSGHARAASRNRSNCPWTALKPHRCCAGRTAGG